MRISFFVGLLFVLGTCWNTTLFAQTETEPATVGFVGSLSEATAVAKEKEMNFFIVVWEDDQNPAYLNTISLLNDSSVIQAFDGKIETYKKNIGNHIVLGDITKIPSRN